MRIYVAGPMRGQPNHGFPAFYRTGAQLSSLGHDPVLPIEDGDLDHFDDPTKPYSEYMKRDIRLLAGCDAILLIDQWMGSVGATFEARCALEFEIPAFRISMTGPGEFDVVLAPQVTEFLRGTT